jgi:hypothetical protein
VTYSGYIAYDAQMARLEEQLREFRRTRAPRETDSEPVTVRPTIAGRLHTFRDIVSRFVLSS